MTLADQLRSQVRTDSQRHRVRRLVLELRAQAHANQSLADLLEVALNPQP